MELVAMYLYARIPVQTNNINAGCLDRLKRHGWLRDTKSNAKFTILSKRFEVDGKWHRTIARFEYAGLNEFGAQVFNLTVPCPFIITECETMESTTTARWRDTKTYHGLKLGGVTGFLSAGVPSAVIDAVYEDFKIHIESN